MRPFGASHDSKTRAGEKMGSWAGMVKAQEARQLGTKGALRDRIVSEALLCQKYSPRASESCVVLSW